ncbi:TPA: ash family protein [Escherichia coli]|nr:ash family protein [Escherichia coli]
MNTYKNRLPASLQVGYISGASHKTGAGISLLPNKIAHDRASGFFTCKASSHLFFRTMVGRMGALSSAPVSILSGKANPVRLTTYSISLVGGELPFVKIGATSWLTADTPALTLSASTPRPKSTVVSIAPAHWQHTFRIVLTACQWICRSSGYHLSWNTLQMICWNCSSLLKPWNKQTKKTHILKNCLRSACWWGVSLPDIQEALCLHR